MSFRLYESAWVTVDGIDTAQRVYRDTAHPGLFKVAGYVYDVDGYPQRTQAKRESAPVIRTLLNIQQVREAGLHTDYAVGL